MTTPSRTRYRSRDWFDTPELYGWLRRAAFKAEGFGEPAYEGRPVRLFSPTWGYYQAHCGIARTLNASRARCGLRGS